MAAGCNSPHWREALRAGAIFGILGAVAGQRAEIDGGLLLIGIGTAILIEHLGAA